MKNNAMLPQVCRLYKRIILSLYYLYNLVIWVLGIALAWSAANWITLFRGWNAKTSIIIISNRE